MNLKAAAAFGAALTLTSCALLPDPAPHVVEASDGTLLLVSSIDDEGMAAIISGTLDVGPGACLYIGPLEDRYAVVLPAGTTFNKEETAVLVPGHDPLTIGTHVELGGGHTRTDNPHFPPVPSACEGEYVALVH